MSPAVTVRAPAKINLSLRVLGVRPDGYHELQTVYQSIALWDTLSFRAHGGPFRLSCHRAGAPADERNLVWRAAAALWAALERPGALCGVSASIRKRIPAAAGLGGGSADAAATLFALQSLWRASLPDRRLRRLAALLGADVPFVLAGGTALGVGRGDIVRPLPDPPRRWIVLVSPPFGVPTAQAYRWFDDDTAPAAVARAEGAAAARRALRRADLASTVVNDLEPCVARRFPLIAEVAGRLRDSGATAAAMSGSGSTIFGLFEQAGRARLAARHLAGPRWTTTVVPTLTRAEALASLRPASRARRGR